MTKSIKSTYIYIYISCMKSCKMFSNQYKVEIEKKKINEDLLKNLKMEKSESIKIYHDRKFLNLP